MSGLTLDPQLPPYVVARVKRDLPNFPAEVIQEWLGIYVLDLGWPPPCLAPGFPHPGHRWSRLLGGRSLWYWRRLAWAQRLVKPRLSLFSAETAEKLQLLIHGCVTGIPNQLTFDMATARPCFVEVVKYVLAHGRWPGSPVATLEPDGLVLADGYHRAAAYLYATGSGLCPSGHQRMWIGGPPGLSKLA